MKDVVLTEALEGSQASSPLNVENPWTTTPNLSGAWLIAIERLRQVEDEGWTFAHDDKHTLNELNWAAGAYLMAGLLAAQGVLEWAPWENGVHPEWPWEDAWFKPSTDPIRNLTKAGALIAAEIDRLQRLNALAETVAQEDTNVSEQSASVTPKSEGGGSQ